MTHREGPATGTLETTARPATLPAAPQLPAGPNGSSWEQIYHYATPTSRKDLLALAARQGLLYAEQLPSNGHAASSKETFSALDRFLSADPAGVDPLVIEPMPMEDDALDACQRDAVAKALQTPDVCLIQGVPGSGKSRVVATIAVAAAAGGERVLLVAPTPATLDYVLAQVAAHEKVCPLRLVSRDECVSALPPSIRALTAVERIRCLRECTVERAHASLEFAEADCARSLREEAVWRALHALAQEYARLQERLRNLEVRLKQLQTEVAERASGDNGPLAAIDAQLAVIDSKMADDESTVGEIERQVRALAPLTSVGWRFWTAYWWQSWFSGDVSGKIASLEQERKRLLDSLQEKRSDRERLVTERTQAVDEECARLRAELDGEQSALRRELLALDEKRQTHCLELASEATRPPELLPATVAERHETWRREAGDIESRRDFAREWLGGLRETLDSLPGRFIECVNLVAATPLAFEQDDQVGDQAPAPASFDLLLVEHADALAPADLSKLAKRTRRLVLVGDLEEELQPAAGEPVGPFRRLWRRWHCDAQRLPCTWTLDKGRLCCRLCTVSDPQRTFLETEKVADCPDIELRILTAPRLPPALAEVVFPPALGIAQAKEYIYRELQELPIQAGGCTLLWLDEADRAALKFGEASGPIVVANLEPGVREVIGVSCWKTFRIEFDRSAGWDRKRAHDWARRHLRLNDLGRTAVLTQTYRMRPNLAELVAEWLAPAGYWPITASAPARNGERAAVVEFMAVPALPRARADRPRTRSDRSRGHSPPHTSDGHLPRTGAGLELDLAEARDRARLPAELLAHPPERGFVNYAEAQAVVRVIRDMLAAKGNSRPAPTLGVLALYAAQAELVRRLLARDPVLAERCRDLKVEGPSGACHVECSVLLVSLTRSHASRAVSFGEHPRALVQALTRASERVILFGDPGTLCRRHQWEGTVDHLDAAGSARERVLIGNIARYLQGRGPLAHAFSLREGP